MKIFILQWECDWADEFDVHGLELVTEEQWNWTNKLFDSVVYPCEKYFGTNEAIIFESKEDILRNVIVIEVTKEEIPTFRKILSNSSMPSFGWTPEFEGSREFYDENGFYPKTDLFR